ncbi:hypothetical protein DENSPDRAFT_837384 [Dentipellis sp. KUC8613]|nr:hypothetical protein DENSPDRAFT_837384 [Dentipellis sp. KUC8613]
MTEQNDHHLRPCGNGHGEANDAAVRPTRPGPKNMLLYLANVSSQQLRAGGRRSSRFAYSYSMEAYALVLCSDCTSNSQDLLSPYDDLALTRQYVFTAAFVVRRTSHSAGFVLSERCVSPLSSLSTYTCIRDDQHDAGITGRMREEPTHLGA